MAMNFGPRGGGAAGGRQRTHARSIYEEMKPIRQWIKEPSADILTLQLPGFVKEQIKIIAETNSRVLSVRGERFGGGNKWIRFNEVISIPEYCDINQIRANFVGDTLRINLPKAISTQPPPLERPQVIEPPQRQPELPTQPHLLPQAQTRPQPQTYPQPAPQLQRPSQPTPRPQPVPRLQPTPRPQPVPRLQPTPRPQPVPQLQRPSQPTPRPQPVPQARPRPSPQTRGPEPPKGITPLPPFEKQNSKTSTNQPTPLFPSEIPRYEQNLQENLAQRGSFPPKAAVEPEERSDHHKKASAGSGLTTADGEKGRDARIVDRERETYKKKREELMNKREINKNYDNAGEEQEHVKSTKAKEKFKVEDYTKAMTGLTRNLNEDRRMLMNMCVAVLVIVALGAYISYTSGGSSESS